MTPDATPLQPIRRLSLSSQVIDALDSYIETNGLQPGDRLMAERELASTLGVSRSLVREAIAVLKERGSVESQHGRGLFLAAKPSPTSAAPAVVNIDGEVSSLELPYIWETRQALETQCARLAALRADAVDLEAMKDALALMEQEILDGGVGLDGDKAFHLAITRASHNPILAALHTGIADALDRTSERSLHKPGQAPHSLRDHHRIFEAIASHEPTEAASSMLDHLVRTTDVFNPAPDVGVRAADASRR